MLKDDLQKALSDDLIDTAEQFPDHAEALIQRVLNKPETFKRLFTRLIHNGRAFRAISEQFPHYAEALIQLILNDPEIFKLFIYDRFALIETAKQFPHHARALIQRLSNDPETFTRIILHSYNLIATAKQFPSHAEALISPVLNDAEIFKRLIQNSYGLRQTAKQFPDHAGALIEVVLNDAETFKRLIRDSYDLIETAKQFPGHRAILGKKSPEEALEALKGQMDLQEISKHARLMGIFREQNQTLLQQLPPEVAKKIILDTRSFRSVSDEQANEQIDAEYGNGVHRLPQNK